jgi:hypothetical protein
MYSHLPENEVDHHEEAVSKQEIGKEAWFHLEVGLPDKGLDPGRNCYHVPDYQLKQMYGPKVQQKGYCYANAKLEKVKQRAEELYKAIHQVDHLPPDMYITESFARALVSEVAHKNRMNWARFVEDVWSRKKTHRKSSAPILYMQEPESVNTLDAIIRSKLELEMAQEQEQHRSITLEHKQALSELEKLCQSPSIGITEEEIEAKADIQRRILTIKCSLDLAILGRDYASELLKIYQGPDGNGSDNVVEKYMEMHSREIQEVQKCRMALESAVQELEGFNGVLKKANDLEVSLRSKMDNLSSNLTKKSTVMRHMIKNSKHPLHLNPSRFILEGGQGLNEGSIKIGPCAMCGGSFPHLDIIVAPCLCLYHPWCAVMQNWISRSCVRESCQTEFTVPWQKSMGLFNIQGIPQTLKSPTFAYCYYCF